MSEPKNERRRAVRKRIETPFPKNLQAVMRERELTIRAVAEIGGVSHSVVAEWLNGGMPHNLLAVQKISNALCVDFEWLLTGSTNRIQTSDIALSQIFVEEDSGLSGIYKIEAKKLRRKGQ